MKDNKYMENIDELMKFVFEGRLLGVDAQNYEVAGYKS